MPVSFSADLRVGLRRFLEMGTALGTRRYLGFFYAFFIAALSAAILYAGPVAQVTYGHDVFILLQGGWEILNGNRPYLDFPALIGPLPLLTFAVGIALVGPTPEAFPVATVLSLVPVSALSWYILSRRLSPWVCLAASTYLALVWAGPFALHCYYRLLSYGMVYNRHSYVFLGLLTVLVLSRERTGRFLLGFLLALLLFTKIPYFISGAFLFIFHLVFNRLTGREVLSVINGFLVIALPLTIYLNGAVGLTNMVLNFIQAWLARTPDVIADGWKLLGQEYKEAAYFMIAAICFLIVLNHKIKPPDKRDSDQARDDLKLAAEAVAILVASAIAEMGGSPLGTVFDIPLLGLYGLILTDRAAATIDFTGTFYARSSFWSALGVIAAALILVVPFWTNTFMGYYTAVADKVTPRNYYTQIGTLDAPGYENAIFVGTAGTYPRGKAYADKINDGLDLIRKHPEMRDGAIATLDFTDGFTCPLRLVPPPHMPLWLQYGVNVNDKVYPRPEEIFDGCQGVMIPRYPDNDPLMVRMLLDRYKGYLSTHYKIVDYSPFWILLKKS